jgi:hypothetical protein
MPDSGRGTNVSMVSLGVGSSFFGGSGTMDGCCAMASWRSAGTLGGSYTVTSWRSSMAGESSFVSWLTGSAHNNSGRDLRLVRRSTLVPLDVPAKESGGLLG